MKDTHLPEGNRVVIGGKLYEAVKGDTCEGCDFYDEKEVMLCKAPQSIPACIAHFRADHKSIIYKEVKEETEELDISGLCRPIGQKFKDRGRILEVVENLTSACHDCFYSETRCSCTYSVHGFCTSVNRLDKKTVIFKMVRL